MRKVHHFLGLRLESSDVESVVWMLTVAGVLDDRQGLALPDVDVHLWYWFDGLHEQCLFGPRWLIDRQPQCNTPHRNPITVHRRVVQIVFQEINMVRTELLKIDGHSANAAMSQRIDGVVVEHPDVQGR